MNIIDKKVNRKILTNTSMTKENLGVNKVHSQTLQISRDNTKNFLSLFQSKIKITMSKISYKITK
jgi:hypothetical protein